MVICTFTNHQTIGISTAKLHWNQQLINVCMVISPFWWMWRSPYTRLFFISGSDMSMWFMSLGMKTLSLKTDLCDNGCSRLINIDHRLIMLSQSLCRAVSSDRSEIDSELFKLSQKNYSSLIMWDESAHLSSPDQVTFCNLNLIKIE